MNSEIYSTYYVSMTGFNNKMQKREKFLDTNDREVCDDVL